jgi:hypothetical protein
MIVIQVNNNILYNKKYLIILDLENFHKILNNINKNDGILFNNFLTMEI